MVPYSGSLSRVQTRVLDPPLTVQPPSICLMITSWIILAWCRLPRSAGHTHPLGPPNWEMWPGQWERLRRQVWELLKHRYPSWLSFLPVIILPFLPYWVVISNSHQQSASSACIKLTAYFWRERGHQGRPIWGDHLVLIPRRFVGPHCLKIFNHL